MSKPSSKKKIREEIKEYSHLLRALKTSSASNLAAHIYDASSKEHNVIGSSTQAEPRTKRDFWTRWPLAPEEVFRPHLSFEEELSTLAEGVLGGEQCIPDDLPLSEHLSSLETAALTGASLHALGQSLSLLSDNFPHVDRGVQSRVQPSDWRLLLQLLADSGIFPDEVLQAVSRRMNALYRPSGNQLSPVLSQGPLLSAQAEFEDLEEELSYDI